MKNTARSNTSTIKKSSKSLKILEESGILLSSWIKIFPRVLRETIKETALSLKEVNIFQCWGFRGTWQCNNLIIYNTAPNFNYSSTFTLYLLHPIRIISWLFFLVFRQLSKYIQSITSIAFQLYHTTIAFSRKHEI